MPKLKYQRPKGTLDILPEEQVYWHKVKDTIRNIAEYHGFNRIDTPIIESTELFSRSIGSSSDIVDKEMFSLKTKGGDKLTLRPEATAAIARAYIENGMKNRRHPVKLYYIGSMFRHEKPQHNRLREFHQFGLEVIGSSSPIIDAQILQIAFAIFKELSINELSVHINSIGCKICRPEYLKALKSFLSSQLRKLPVEYRKRIQANPLRLFDIKDEKCERITQEAPQIVDHLCEDCRANFEKLLEFLDFLDIPYVFNPYLVRGLDYYSGPVYEILPSNKDYAAKEALGGGGRYDYLIKSLGGRDVPATGIAFGLERLIGFMKENNIRVDAKREIPVFISHLGDFGQKRALKLTEELRKENLYIQEGLSKSGLKPQKKIADKSNTRFTVLVSQMEALEENVILRDQVAGTQEVIAIKDIAKKIREALKKTPKIKKDKSKK
ncbi:MAG: histidine--tRNA ligase [Candidatus Paceibacterota bacterium]|jgi:histidyl-tRNA synthetase